MNNTQSTAFEKLSNEHTERSLIGCYLIDPECFRNAEDLRADVFTRPDCRAIFLTMRTIWRANGEFDAVSVAQGLKAKGQLEDIGGTEGLESLAALVPGSYNAATHAKTLEGLRRRRQAVSQLATAIESVSDLQIDLDDVAEQIVLPWQSTDSRSFETITSAELDAQDLDVKWLVDGIIPQGRPGILAGPMKAGKSLLSVSLAVSVASGRPWAGCDTSQSPVLMLSCESGPGALRAVARRVCKAEGLRLPDLALNWQFSVVDLASPKVVSDLRRYIDRSGTRLAILDPAYLLFGAAAEGVNNQYAMGALLAPLNSICVDTGCSILLNSHYTKSMGGHGQTYGQPELSWIAHAGWGAWARWWLLVNRRSAYDPEQRGIHSLWINGGGSDGQSFGWAVDLDEGLSGGGWQMTVVPASECRAESADEQQQQKHEQSERKRQLKTDRLDAKVQSVLQVHGRTWLPAAQIRGHSGLNSVAVGDALCRLVASGIVAERQSTKRRDSREYLLSENVESVARDEAERAATGQKTRNATKTKKSPYPSGLSSPLAAGADVAGTSSEGSGQSGESPVSPVSPVDGGKRKNSRRKQSGTNGTTSTKRRRIGAVILNGSGSLVEPSGVDVAGDDVPEVVSADVSEGVPF
jgi:hypothetical protein